MKTIGVMTSGGDCAGMNAALRAVVRRAAGQGIRVIGVRRGYGGLVEHAFEELGAGDVAGILHRGGTVLQTFRCPEFSERTTRDAAKRGLAATGIDGLVVIGGDGSLRGLKCIDEEWGIAGVGIPASIDNDISGTDVSIGFDTALNIATDAVDKIRDTATSHGRIFVIEVMGRACGILAAATGLCCGAEEVIVPEVEFDLDAMAERIEQGYNRGKQHAIVILAEGAGRASTVGDSLRHKLQRSVRIAVLGHIQRGGSPTSHDRILASRLGSAAVDRLVAGQHGVMVGMQGSEVIDTPLSEVTSLARPSLDVYLQLQRALV